MSLRLTIAGACLLLAGCGGTDGASCPNDLPAQCPASVPGFSSEISPLINNRCLPCHAPGGQESVTPLTNYQEIFQQRVSVLNQVYHCNMPLPGNPQLTADERALLLNWLVCNSPDN
jgi:uncharacterized membrane protein